MNLFRFVYQMCFLNVLRIKIFFFVFLLFLSICSCNKKSVPVERGFYYWKTTYAVSPSQKKLLQNLSVKKIYLRVFDIDWDAKLPQPIPIQQVRFISKVDTCFHYVPVIYIANGLFQHIGTEQLSLLAKRISEQIEHIGSDNQFGFNELQVDCDWTESTSGKYFELLKFLKESSHKKNRIISATIRLHQVKYAKRTGVPPVDRGMLMFYNMGKINAAASTNSIYDFQEAEKYIHFADNYSLPLDGALPLFSWGIHIRNNSVIGLVNDVSVETVEKNNYFRTTGSSIFKTDSSFFYHGIYFLKGDELKVEEISPDICLTAANQLEKNIHSEQITVSLFDLDSLNITRYDENDLEKIFSCFN
jgi:hypothetical protein